VRDTGGVRQSQSRGRPCCRLCPEWIPDALASHRIVFGVGEICFREQIVLGNVLFTKYVSWWKGVGVKLEVTVR
jgi:hypothetical protein